MVCVNGYISDKWREPNEISNIWTNRAQGFRDRDRGVSYFWCTTTSGWHTDGLDGDRRAAIDRAHPSRGRTWREPDDSAESYGAGHSEEVVGQALQGRRDKWIIATKVSPNNGLDANDSYLPTQAKKRIVEAVEGSLKRLNTDYIDIYQLHAIPLEGAMPAVMEALAKLRVEGKIRWYGVSTNDREAIDKLRGLGEIHLLQIGYNLLERDAADLLHFAKRGEYRHPHPRSVGEGDVDGQIFPEQRNSERGYTL